MKIATVEFVKSATGLKDCPPGEFVEIALAGRSNVGKSSFLNKMVNRKGLARTSNTPGRTRLINFFMINNAFYLVDLPGYGYARVPEKMKLEWGKSIQEYLERRERLAAVVLLLDIRHLPTVLDINLYKWLEAAGIPVILAATKTDKLSKSQSIKQAGLIRRALELGADVPMVLFSAKTGQGREDLWEIIGGIVDF